MFYQRVLSPTLPICVGGENISAETFFDGATNQIQKWNSGELKQIN